MSAWASSKFYDLQCLVVMSAKWNGSDLCGEHSYGARMCICSFACIVFTELCKALTSSFHLCLVWCDGVNL